MPKKIAPRHIWAAELVEAAPDDTILEIGCGHGLATGLVVEALGADGHLVAIDQSAKMVAACRARNGAAATAGRLTVLEGVFEATDFDRLFDKAFAVNVDFALHKDFGWAQKFAAVMQPGGVVHLILEAPAPAKAERFANEAKASLEAVGFAATILAGPGAMAVSARLA